MATEESPAVARRRLRLALRRMREAGGYTQQQVADELSWSLSKVQRIESGEVGISVSDVKSLLAQLSESDPLTIARLVDDAKAARQRGWWSKARYRDHLTPATIKLLQFEGEAKYIRVFQPTMAPGILQTRETAEQVLQVWRVHLPEDERAIRLEVRMLRHDHVFTRSQPPTYLLALDESAVMRAIGGTSTLIAQIQRLIDETEAGRITVRLLPISIPAPYALLGSFTLLEMEEEEVLYREGWRGDEMIFDQDRVARHRDGFEQIWSDCLTPAATLRFLRAREAILLSSLDQPS